MSSQSYQPISDEISKELATNLTDLQSKYQHCPQIIIEVESGNSIRDKVAKDLEKVLVPKKLGYYPKGNTYIGRFPDYPISVFSSSENLQYTQDFIRSISPYLKSQYFIDTSFSSNQQITFYINGTPTFNQEGQVKVE